MPKRPFWIALALFAVVAVAVGWYLFRPELLFIDTTVQEDFPGVAAPAQPEATAPDMQEGETTAQKPAAPVQPAEPVALVSGRFHGVAHEGTGIATIYQLPDGKRILRFTEFDVLNGPDLYVYMVAAPDANDNETVEQAGFVSLGRLKGNRGDQNYELPADLDLSVYRSVSIWCQRFGVNFAVAPLN